LYPVGIAGSTDGYTDVAFDAQFENKISDGSIVAYATYITEKRTLDATYALGLSSGINNKLNSFRMNCTYNFPALVGITVGYFSWSGDSDPILYAPGAVGGSVSGSPNSNGIMAQIAYIPWATTEFTLQYVLYNKFNGQSTNYDGAGRDASDNNTIYLNSSLLF